MNKNNIAIYSEKIEAAISPSGLCLAGWFNDGKDEVEFAGALIGSRGPAMWRSLIASAEFNDGLSDPMNRWTERVLGEAFNSMLASNAELVFPFGNQLWPFQRWGIHATGNESSPLGLLINPEFGLWHAFRGALLFKGQGLIDEVTELNRGRETEHPCFTCIEKPCLSACPVQAFSDSNLDVTACFSHLDSKQEPDCMTLGCRARDACPVGQAYRYSDDQIRFHMKRYRGANSA